MKHPAQTSNPVALRIVAKPPQMAKQSSGASKVSAANRSGADRKG
jgi:hypothetical protein